MILLESLYRLLFPDQQVRMLDPFFERTETTAAAALISVNVDVPERHALILTHVHGRFVPGAGQNVDTPSDIRMQNPQVSRFVVLRSQDNALGANVVTSLVWQGHAVLTPGCTIATLGTFNAGVAANQVTLSVYGMLIPLGNVERIG